MNKKVVLVTGCNGYIGNHLCRVIQENYSRTQLFGIDIVGSNNVLEKNKIFRADIADENRVENIVRMTAPDNIFHLAGVIDSKNWEDLYEGNVEKTSKFLEVIKKTGSIARILIPGSAAEYRRVERTDLPIKEKLSPNPISFYELSKVFQTSRARFYALQGMNVVVGRVFNFIGEGMPNYLAVGTFINQINRIKSGKSKNEIMVGNIKTRRDFLDINDVCTGLVAAALKGRKGEIYNICSGHSVTMKQILRIMMNKSGVKIKIKPDRKRIKIIDIKDIYGSNRKIKIETSWRPSISICASIEKCLC